MSKSPVALFVYNRADHFRQVYDALAKCNGAGETDLYIFSDGAKNESGAAAVAEVRGAIREKENAGDFKSFNVVAKEKNAGLAASIIAGVTEILAKYGRIIVIEDDCQPSPYMLDFFNRCLEEYESDKSIGSIAGFTPEFEYPEYYKADVFLARRSCSCAWATWTDRWENVDWTGGCFRDFVKDRKLRRRLCLNGSDRFFRLKRRSQGKAQSWSICFGAHHALKDWWVLYPRYSYIRNIGNDGSGVHTRPGEMNSQHDLALALEHPDITKPPVDARIQKRLKKVYSGGFLSDLKRLVMISLYGMLS